MAKQKLPDTVATFNQEEFSHVDAVDNVNENYLVYSAAAIMRMIPDVRDGLIPVQRRIIHTMNKDAKLTSTSKHMKVAKVAGLVLGYHPHGDKAVSDALTRLSQEWNYYLPLVDVAGNKGSTLATDSWAAARYIECRLTPYSEALLRGMKNNAVDMVANYDNTAQEPTVLPAEIPLLYTNGTAGSSKMSVGFSTDIPPHNVVELLRAAELLNRKPNSTLASLMKIVPAPDLPTGNILLGLDEMETIYTTGVGKFTLRAKAEIIDGDIVISEIPYGTTRQSLIAAMVDAISKDNLETQIKSIEDESIGNDDGTEEIRMVIYCEKNADPENILNFLYKKTPLQKNYNCRMLAIVDGKPQFLGLREYLELFLEFRRTTIRRIYTFDVEKKKQRLHIVEGFLKMIDIAEEVIKTIKAANGKQDSADQIEKLYGFTHIQAEAIVSMQLYRISNQDFQALRDEQDQLTKDIDHLEHILSDEQAFQKEISRLLNATIKDMKHVERKSVLDTQASTDVEVKTTNLIAEQDVMTVVTPYGVQRMTPQVYDNNKEKVDTPIIGVFDSKTTDGVALFTRKGLVMQRQVHEVENLSIRSTPEDLRKTVSTFTHDDEVIYSVTFPMDSITDTNLDVISVTAQGQVKKSKLEDSFLAFTQKGYLTRTKAYNGLKVSGDSVVWVKVVPRDTTDTIVLSLKKASGGRAATVKLADLSYQGASGSGVRGIKVPAGDTVGEVVVK